MSAEAAVVPGDEVPVPFWLTQEVEKHIEQLAQVKLRLLNGCTLEEREQLIAQSRSLNDEISQMIPEEGVDFSPFVQVRLTELSDQGKAHRIARMIQELCSAGREKRCQLYDEIERTAGISSGEAGTYKELLRSGGFGELVSFLEERLAS